MSEKWNAFLRTEGARHAQGEVRDFGHPPAERQAARTGNVLVDLTHLSLIRAAGADSATFLNGQLTCDIERVDAGHSRLGAWCSPKGRMLALFRLFRRDDWFLLQLPAALRESTLKRLRVYVLRSKVALEDADNACVRFGIVGADAPALLRATLGAVPAAVNDVAFAGDVACARLHGIRPRFEILAAPDRAPPLWLELKRGAVAAGAAAWTWHDVMAGVPDVYPETADAFVPQMANLDLLDGVSFDKGCYTGQEIVARVHYRGRLKQRMYRARAPATANPPRPGDPVYAPAAPEQPAGTVAVAVDGDDGHDLLVVARCDAVAAGTLCLHRPDGPQLSIEPLPYPLPA